MAISKKMMEQYNEMMAALMEKVKGEQKVNGLLEWGKDVLYCLDHMDEKEYGQDVLNNLEKFVLHKGGKKVEITDRVVLNTQLALLKEVNDLAGLKLGELLDTLPVPKDDTLMPEGKWLYRTYRFFIKKNLHSYSVQFTAEKNTDCLEEILKIVKDTLCA